MPGPEARPAQHSAAHTEASIAAVTSPKERSVWRPIFLFLGGRSPPRSHAPQSEGAG